MWLLGHIGKQQILILIDSGSSGNFISQELVNTLQLVLPQPKWGVQLHKFTTFVRVLPLKCYDMILRMEWLECCNKGKMFVDWTRKKMRHQGGRELP
jgi:hypothetical protein